MAAADYSTDAVQQYMEGLPPESRIFAMELSTNWFVEPGDWLAQTPSDRMEHLLENFVEAVKQWEKLRGEGLGEWLDAWLEDEDDECTGDNRRYSRRSVLRGRR